MMGIAYSLGLILRRSATIKANVPNDPAAELMYYLNCIYGLFSLPGNEEIERLRKYKKYKTLTHEDRDALLQHCMEASPDKLLNNCLFQDDSLCYKFSNEFYKVESVDTRRFVTGEVFIGEKQWQVTKIMAFKIKWLKSFWFNAMNDLIARQEIEKVQRNKKSAWCFFCEKRENEEDEESGEAYA